MAGRLGIPETEMHVRLRTLFARMGASTPADAVATALRRGLVVAVQ
jgi:hypothetical protein